MNVKKNTISKLLLIFVLAAMVLLLKPSTVFALTDAEIKENKEITIKSVPITDLDSYYQVNEAFYFETGYSLFNCNSTYTTCTVIKGVDETDEVIATGVTVKYDYDEDVKRVVDGIITKIPEGGKAFYVDDIHAIKWMLDQVELDRVDEYNEGINPIMYSPEFNAFVGYNNFFFEPRMGDDTMYANFQEGTSRFMYNGTMYGFGHMKTRVNHVLYVNDNETDIEGALKTRLSKYFNIDKIVKDNDVTYEDMINDELDTYRQDYNDCVHLKTLEQELAALTDQEEINAKQNEINNFGYYGPTDLDEEYASADAYAEAMRAFITDENSMDAMWNMVNKVLPNVYVIYFTDGGDELSSGIPVFVVKDSSKVFDEDLEVKTRDTKSGVTISSVGTSKKLPFDTLVKVSKLTSGSDYDKVVSALESLVDKDNIEMFDLKLFSNSIEGYITKLDDGSFKVKIPVSDKFKSASALVAYYVDDKNEVHEYPVTIEMEENVRYAVFTTDHFSIYTLAEKEPEPEPTYHVTYNFNGGVRQGETEHVTEQVGVVVDLSKEAFVDNFDVTPPTGKVLDAIEVNGVRMELDGNYAIDKDTVFKYLWKDAPTEEPVLPDEEETGAVGSEEETEEPASEAVTDTKEDTTKETTKEVKTDNPTTGDNILTYVAILSVSVVGLIGAIVLLKKRKFN